MKNKRWHLSEKEITEDNGWECLRQYGESNPGKAIYSCLCSRYTILPCLPVFPGCQKGKLWVYV